MSTTIQSQKTQFVYTDKDGDRLRVMEGELGAVIWANSHDHEQVVVAVRYADLPALIETLTAIKNNEG
jgi:hypothetical protein